MKFSIRTTMLIERNLFNEYVLPVGHQQKNIMVSRDTLKGLNAGGAFQFVGRCPTLLIHKAFSLNLTAMRSKLVPAEKKNIFFIFLFFIKKALLLHPQIFK